jgi:hypothetical protein
MHYFNITKIQMKKSILLLFFIYTLFSVKTYAQEVKNTIKINPLSALVRVGSIFYERKISPSSSLQLGIAYVRFKTDETKFSGLALTPEYRYFIKKNSINGLYVGPFAKYQNFRVTAGTDYGRYNSFGGGVSLGRQWGYSSGLVLDMFLGPVFNSGKYSAESGAAQVSLTSGIDGFGVRAGITIGFGL